MNEPVDLNRTPVVTAAAIELYSSSTPRTFSIAVFVQPYINAKQQQNITRLKSYH